MSLFRSSVFLLAFGLSTPTLIWAADTESPMPAKPQTTTAAAYTVRVNVADAEAQEMLQEHLPLISQRVSGNLDWEQINFLVEDTPAQAKQMLETLGYFDSKVTVVRQADDFSVNVTLGPRVKVADVSVLLQGQLLQDEDLPDYYRRAMQDWSLQLDNPFKQKEWSNSKTAVLSSVVRKKYPLAKIATSQATIDPKALTAKLDVTVDSKQPVFFGDIQVEGSKRYPDNVVTGLADFQYGAPYDLDKLLDYQQALEQDGHFSNAMVHADLGSIHNDHVPIKVQITEVPRQKLDLGLRYDSAEGPGIRLAYDHYSVFRRGYIASSVVDVGRYEQNVSFGLSQPRSRSGHYYTTSLNYNNSAAQNVRTKALTTGLWRVRNRDHIDSRLGVEYIWEDARIVNGGPDLGTTTALMLTASWKSQKIETPLRPANGYFLEGKIGSTLGRLGSSGSLQRLHGQAAYYFTPEERRYGTLVVRGELGFVNARDNQRVPTSLLFRSGGSSSIRGYEHQSVGIAGPNDSVLGGKVLAVGSIEYQIPVAKNYSIALFHDVGDVTDSWNNFKLKQGTGIGLRWFSPIAPLSLDIAHSHNDRKIRWHLSLGTRF